MKKKNSNMVRRIIVIASAFAIIMGSCVGIIGFTHIRKAYYTSFQEGLHAAAILLEDELSNQFEGNWSLSEDGHLLKGETAIHDIYQWQLDGLNERTGMHYTVFYGDTRYVTSLVDSETGLRMEGTKASDAVVVNVNNVDSSTRMIAEKIHLLNELKASFSDIIAELSAISQQNAASTQQTNASMEELNATFSLISSAASDLRSMAETLNEKMSYFTIEKMSV